MAEPSSANTSVNIGLKIKTYSILDDYTVSWGQKLGTGINGPVRPCTKRSTGERYALKVLLDKPKAQTEVNLHVRSSGHPNIVTVYDVYANDVQFPGEDHPRPRLLMVMELMDGGELFDRISQRRGFTEKQVVQYVRQISQAIQRCHGLNIAHRDLKPENLLLKDNSEDSPVKLTDFGFAKVDEGDLVTPHYTPYYVSPQVLEAQRQQRREQRGIISAQYTYDKSCDMWSLGVVMYIMFCGYPPFYSETPSKTITKDMKRRIMAGEYEFPSDEWNVVSGQAKDVIKQLLCVEAQDRMRIDELLVHPWLQLSTPLPNMALHSPSILMDKNSLEEAKEAHSRQLTAMRLPEPKLTLKPLAIVDNPIMRKRRNQRNVSLDNRQLLEPPEKRRVKDDIGITRLRDVIAHCILPPRDESGDEKLCYLVHQACQCNSDNRSLQRLLHKLNWNGEKFTERVDRSKLAEYISRIVEDRALTSRIHTEKT
ncbi:MAP kinase-activated protein kinase 5-like [Ptychodera flava]|uniref:MAP kinase-activated protein kinase 5-like n=1 Tax=Ptychodera flava TaxID=63121 RepID=UPI00396A2106